MPTTDERTTDKCSPRQEAMVELGHLMRQVREREGVSAREFAGRLDVSEATVSRWERGQVLPERKHLARLVHLLTPALIEQGRLDAFDDLLERIGFTIPRHPSDGAEDGELAAAWRILSRRGPITAERLQIEAHQLHVLGRCLDSTGIVWRYRQMIKQVTQADWAYQQTSDGYEVHSAAGAETLARIYTELAFTLYESVPVRELDGVIAAGEEVLVLAANAALSESRQHRLEAPAYLILGLTARRLEAHQTAKPGVQLYKDLLEKCIGAAGFDPQIDNSKTLIDEAWRLDQDAVEERLADCHPHISLE